MKHEIAIVVKYHGPTNNNGSRYSLTLPRWDNKRIYCSWNHALGDSAAQAESLLQQAKITPRTLLDMDSHYIITVSFDDVDKITKLFNLD